MTDGPVCTVDDFMQGCAVAKFDHYVNINLSCVIVS